MYNIAHTLKTTTLYKQTSRYKERLSIKHRYMLRTHIKKNRKIAQFNICVCILMHTTHQLFRVLVRVIWEYLPRRPPTRTLMVQTSNSWFEMALSKPSIEEVLSKPEWRVTGKSPPVRAKESSLQAWMKIYSIYIYIERNMHFCQWCVACCCIHLFYIASWHSTRSQ